MGQKSDSYVRKRADSGNEEEEQTVCKVDVLVIFSSCHSSDLLFFCAATGAGIGVVATEEEVSLVI